MPADCSLRSISSCHAEMVAALKSEGDLSVDCSAITTCDITGIQLLVSAAKTAEAAGRVMRLAGVPETLGMALARAGLALSPAADRILINEV
ncbi:STAS domain-containing protein [Bosea psychrotolerans]|nr:STAS domain-containing protein [Bosea psychrotolerans]